jgi:hypothetical protein
MVTIKLEIGVIKKALGNGASNFQLYVGRRITEEGTVFTDQEYAQMHPDHVETLNTNLERGFISITSSGFGVNINVTQGKELDEISGDLVESEKGQPNGIATLDITGKLETSQIPSGIIGGLNYKGTWDASTNTPTLGDSGIGGIKGDYYIVSVSGNTPIDGITDWIVTDWIVNNGTIWQKVDNTQFNDDTFILKGARNNANVTNIYLRNEDGIFLNLTPEIIPFNATLIAISASTESNETWTAEIRKKTLGVWGLIPNAFLTMTNITKNHGVYSIDVNAGDELSVYCNGNNIDHPRITAVFRRR